jgi:YVTN family beta-propeller protein
VKGKTIYLKNLIIFSCIFSGCSGQQTPGINLLKVEKVIDLPGVKGRIDHLDFNLKDQVVYVAALGNNTVEVVDIRNGKVIRSIKGFDEPQGVAYIPQRHEIFVANGGNGKCFFYNADSFEKTATIDLSSDADDVRYDPTERKIYVGYGEGGIAIIDAVTHKQIDDIKLPAHPESFQIDGKLHLLFVNLPNANMVAVIDLVQKKLISKWTRISSSGNFPMALDTIHHNIFVVYRHPAKLVTFDGITGKELNVNNAAGDADDLYYDQSTSQVFISGGSGYINIFKQNGINQLDLIGNVPTHSGARTSLLIPQLKQYIVAERTGGNTPARLIVYKLMP